MPSELQAQLRAEKGRAGGATCHTMPTRYFLQRPVDTGNFILPLKQSFMKDARLMPGTRCMLALLAGWAGQGGALLLTEGTIGKHIGRSVRQVYRYLQDAAREGYLRYSYTKNNLGMITGLRIWLTFNLIRSLAPPITNTGLQKPARTHTSYIKKTDINNPSKDVDLSRHLEKLGVLIEYRSR